MMNDLTKEELDFLFEMIKKYNHADLTGYQGVYCKINSLINNYYEHNKIGFLGDVYGYECKDCGADINRNLITDEQHVVSMYD